MRAVAAVVFLLVAVPVGALGSTIRVIFDGHFTEANDAFSLLPPELSVGGTFSGSFELREPVNVINIPDGIRFDVTFLFEAGGVAYDSLLGEASLYDNGLTPTGRVDQWVGGESQRSVEEIGTGRTVRRSIAFTFVDNDATMFSGEVPQIPLSLDGWESVQLRISFDRVILFPGYDIFGTVDHWHVPEPSTIALLAIAAIAAASLRGRRTGSPR